MLQNIKKIYIYTDGGARGNPGPAALGAVIADEKGNTIKKYGETLGVKTNNEAEYEAIIFALKKAKQIFGSARAKKMFVVLHSDSELAMRQLNGQYKIENEKLQPLFLAVWNLRLDFGSVEFRHIKREKNKEADRLVNEALDQESGIKNQELGLN